MKEILLFNPYFKFKGGGNIVQKELVETLKLSLPNSNVIVIKSYIDFLIFFTKVNLKFRKIIFIQQGVFSPIYLFFDFLFYFVNVKLIVIPRGDYIPNGSEKWSVSNRRIKLFFWKFFISKRLKKALNVVFTSEIELSRYIEAGISDKCKVSIIPDAFNFHNRFSTNRSNNGKNLIDYSYFLYVGRISIEKNLLFLIDAYVVFVEKIKIDSNIPHLVFFTPTKEGSYFNDLKEKIEISKLNNLIHFIDESHCDLGYVYNNCLVNLLPSHIESFGLTVLEALGHNKISIVSENVPWFYSNKKYIYPTKLNVKTWAEKFFFVYSNENLILNVNLREELDFFSPNVLKKLWFNLIMDDK